MNTLKLVIAQVIRHILSIAVGYLGAVGVTPDLQNEFVETAVNWIVVIVIALGVQYWSYLQKRMIPAMIEKGIQAPPNTTVEKVVAQTKLQEGQNTVY